MLHSCLPRVQTQLYCRSTGSQLTERTWEIVITSHISVFQEGLSSERLRWDGNTPNTWVYSGISLYAIVWYRQPSNLGSYGAAILELFNISFFIIGLHPHLPASCLLSWHFSTWVENRIRMDTCLHGDTGHHVYICVHIFSFSCPLSLIWFLSPHVH